MRSARWPRCDRDPLSCVLLAGEPGARMAGMRWQIRPFAQAADLQCVERLGLAAMPPAWPLLTAGIAQLSAGLMAEAGSDPVGFAAVDMGGSIPLILVAPAYQRRGVGTILLASALDHMRAGVVTRVTAASRCHCYILSGEPCDLPAQSQFLCTLCWSLTHY